jgi:hypothetical protein
MALQPEVLVEVLVILVLVLPQLKLVNQAIVEHTDLDLVEDLVLVLQIMMLLVVVAPEILASMAVAVQEMVDQEKIIVQYLEQQ